MAARSFSVTVSAPDGLARPLAAVRSEVGSPTGGLVFVSGALTQELPEVAAQVRSAWRNVPVCVVPGAGVLTERGEFEGTSAASGVLWSGGRVVPLALGDASSPAALRESIGGVVGAKAATVLLFPRSDFSPDMLDGLGAAAPNACIFGGGTVGGPAITVTASGELLRGRIAGMATFGLAPLVESSPACRLLTPMRRIDEVSGGLVLRIDGEPALDVLSSCVPELRSSASSGPPQPQPVVFAAIADASSDPAPTSELEGTGEASERYVVRPVRGIDPTRRGVMVGIDAKPGLRMSFAVRDAAAARVGVESIARQVMKQALGSAPRFAVYLSCAGRGQGLYGSPDVESRILRQRFGDLPIAGMHSAFEIAPWGPGNAKVALYTGVLALFRSPS